MQDRQAKEISRNIPRLVIVFSSKTHGHRHAWRQFVQGTIREIEHIFSAPFELYLTVDGRRVERRSQVVTREARDVSHLVGEPVGFQGAHGLALGVHADVLGRDLRRTALGALAAVKAKKHLSDPPHGRKPRPLVLFASLAEIGRQDVPPHQVRRVVVQGRRGGKGRSGAGSGSGVVTSTRPTAVEVDPRLGMVRVGSRLIQWPHDPLPEDPEAVSEHQAVLLKGLVARYLSTY